MKQFARIFYDLDQTNKTNEKVDILLNYMHNSSEQDKLWMLALFTGRRPRRTINSTYLRMWAADFAGIPDWLFEECYTVVGDLSETIALLLPPPKNKQDKSLSYWITYVKDLADCPEEERKIAFFEAWDQMEQQERFVFNKITSSTFRVGVSQSLVVRALSQYTDTPVAVLTHRLMGKWDPESITFSELVLADYEEEDHSRPYPFYLAYALDAEPDSLGSSKEWNAEWKWDGIRSQIIKRNGKIFIWSRGEDLITDKFPELQALKNILPDGTVIDGEILPFKAHPLPFSVLQTRIGRKNLTPKILKEAPAIIYAYDLLEWKGVDIREKPLVERQILLDKLVEEVNFKPYLQLPPKISFEKWEELKEVRERSRDFFAEGLMLKNKLSTYKVGRKRGDWWKWKVDPFTIDAVMVYAQRGTGRRANLYTDYTFAVWNDKELITFAKAYSGLTDKEILEVDKWVRNNTVEKFGPVRTLKPELVFELGFEGIQRSNRHKSGVALRFPRILRWRKDKRKDEADTLQNLHALLEMYEKTPEK